jgi:hypothetical protein
MRRDRRCKVGFLPAVPRHQHIQRTRRRLCRRRNGEQSKDNQSQECETTGHFHNLQSARAGPARPRRRALRNASAAPTTPASKRPLRPSTSWASPNRLAQSLIPTPRGPPAGEFGSNPATTGTTLGNGGGGRKPRAYLCRPAFPCRFSGDAADAAGEDRSLCFGRQAEAGEVGHHWRERRRRRVDLSGFRASAIGADRAGCGG